MGGCLSIPLPWGQMGNYVSQWLWSEWSCIQNLPENLESLENTIERLEAKRDDVQRRVDREEFMVNQRRLAQVQVWLTNVLEIENQFNDLINTSELESQRSCLAGICSQNLIESNIYGKRIIKMLKEAENLSQIEFPVVTQIVGPSVEAMPVQAIIVGQETMLEMVWNRLIDDEVGIVGLYGMGGVGKTTLLTQINNKFSNIASQFDIVIWVVISNGALIYKIQSDIGEKLGLTREEWNKKNESQRAFDIHNVLRRKKFVLLLDDIWDKVNLERVGVPYPNKNNGSKVAFTTRSKDVCGRMGVDDPMKVTCLDPERAWELFQKKVGVNTLKTHPDIPELAWKVAEKCCGLPLALNVIGETMACKTTVQEWRCTIQDLTSSIADFPYIENDVLPILKCSYDSLRGQKVQSCFLYCSLFPEDYKIQKEMLIEYWICEGFIDENEGREMALNRGYEILGTLIRACLLIDETQSVRMHDVVREMALWITTDFGKNKDQYIVQAGVGLHEVPKVTNWKNVKKMSLMGNDIRTITDSLECPELTTLFLQDNTSLAHISGEFFQSLTRLLVLNLSFTNITELAQVSKMASLRYLDLTWTWIERLPFDLKELKMLTHLNLECTFLLENLCGISKLSSLRTLRLISSNVKLDMTLMNELDVLEHLEYITIDISHSLVEKQLSYDSRVWRCIQEVKITDLRNISIRIIVLPEAMINLHRINIERCEIIDIKIEKTTCNKSLSAPSFSNLSIVDVTECDGLKDLTWLLFVPNLTSLNVSSLRQIESIINEEKAASVLDKEDSCKIIPFQKLKLLFLEHLPELKSIYWTSLPFPSLRAIFITSCLNLSKLPLDSQSIMKIEGFTINCEEEWIENVEWEDEDTKLRFLPSVLTN